MLRVALFTERGRMLRILLGLEIIHSLCFSLRMLLFWRPLRRAWRVADLKVPINHYIIHYVQWTNVRNGNECTQRTNVRNGQMYAMDKCTQRINVRNGRMYAMDECTQRTNVRNGQMYATDKCTQRTNVRNGHVRNGQMYTMGSYLFLFHFHVAQWRSQHPRFW